MKKLKSWEVTLPHKQICGHVKLIKFRHLPYQQYAYLLQAHKDRRLKLPTPCDRPKCQPPDIELE